MKIFFVLCFAIAAVAAKRTFNGDQVLRIYTKNRLDVQQIEQLESRFPSISFWTDVHGSAPVDIHVEKKDLPALKAALSYGRIQYEIFIEDLQVAIDNQVSDRPAQMDLASFDYYVYHTLDEINQWIEDMVAREPSPTRGITATKIIYGTSYEGRPISALKLSTGGVNKPAFVIDCGIHAREWVSPATCLYTANKLYEEEKDYLEKIDIYITPSGNPDGYAHTWTGDRMWRKTRSNTGAVCLGVDPNRNWDINWAGPGASSSPCNDAYYGPSPMSEIEVLSKAEFIDGIPNVQAYIDVHAYSQYWMHPYAYTYAKSPDEAFLTYLGGQCVSAIYNVHGETYQYGSISEVIYQASGSTTDFMYEVLGIKCSFAAELRDKGRYGFTLPERFIQPTAEETFAGLEVISKAVVDGLCA